MLGNLRLPETGTVVEIQVTTAPMLDLKNSAAHGVCRIGRESSPHGAHIGAWRGPTCAQVQPRLAPELVLVA